MTIQMGKWKRWRAVAANKLAPEPGMDGRAIRDEAIALRSRGLKWFTTGFEDWDPEQIIHILKQHGVVTSEQWFQDNAKNYPGPTEIAEIWSQSLTETGKDAMYVAILPYLAARALWAKLLPDVASIETTADKIESRLLTATHLKQKPNERDILATAEFIATQLEGSTAVRKALDAELPVTIGTWFVNALHGLNEMEDPAAWQKVTDALAPNLNSECYLHGFLSLAMAKAGHGDHALAATERAVAIGDDAPSLYQVCAQAVHKAGLYQRAVELAKEALLRCDYEPHSEHAARLTLGLALEALGQEGDMDRHLQEVNLNKRKQMLALRKDRKRKDKKAGRR